MNDLDENERKMLIQYLHQVYEKDPDQFPFPKEVVDDLLQQYNQMEQEQREEGTESVKDIRSEEMVIEDSVKNQNSQQ